MSGWFNSWARVAAIAFIASSRERWATWVCSRSSNLRALIFWSVPCSRTTFPEASKLGITTPWCRVSVPLGRWTSYSISCASPVLIASAWARLTVSRPSSVR